MKNVLIIIGKLVVGGAEKVGRDIGYYADKEKFSITYIVFEQEKGIYEEELEEQGCTIYHFDPPHRGYLKFCMRLSRVIRERHIDIVHSHTMFNSGLVTMIARWNRVPIRITHSHSIKGPEHRGFIKNSYEKMMRRSILLNSTKLVACGKSAGEWLYGKNIFHDKGILIYNGIHLESYRFSSEIRNSIREHLGLKEAFIIGHVGHLAFVKNQLFIINLLPEIIKEKPEAVFMMVGDGNDRSILLEAAQKLGVEKHVVFTGNVNNVGDYMSAMDVFVFPSLYEGMPLALVEAQTNGLPCVISNRIPKDVFVTDLLCDLSLENHEKQWVQTITGMERNRSDQYWSKMYELGFDTSVMLRKIYQLYEN